MEIITTSIFIQYRSLLLFASTIRSILKSNDFYLFSFLGIQKRIEKNSILNRLVLKKYKLPIIFVYLLAMTAICAALNYCVNGQWIGNIDYVNADRPFCIYFKNLESVLIFLATYFNVVNMVLLALLWSMNDNFDICSETKWYFMTFLFSSILCTAIYCIPIVDVMHDIILNWVLAFSLMLKQIILYHFPVFHFFYLRKNQVVNDITKTIEYALTNQRTFGE
eukprot:NODE_150_length_15491_cov_0.365644.p8 type:complete len:222 gc:universal NODE_150_length_15491_cov_0.365644:14797-15462(+)